MNLTLTYHLQSPSPASHGHETLMSESSDNLNLVVLLYMVLFSPKRLFKVGTHLAKLQAQ